MRRLKISRNGSRLKSFLLFTCCKKGVSHSSGADNKCFKLKSGTSLPQCFSDRRRARQASVSSHGKSCSPCALTASHSAAFLSSSLIFASGLLLKTRLPIPSSIVAVNPRSLSHFTCLRSFIIGFTSSGLSGAAQNIFPADKRLSICATASHGSRTSESRGRQFPQPPPNNFCQ